jgi:hypothetical protein
MGLFRRKKKQQKLLLIQEEMMWVWDNYKWLIQTFGLPNSEYFNVEVTKDYFPNTFSDKVFSINNVISDLCILLDLPKKKISFEFQEDLRGTIPYESEGYQDVYFEIIDGNYKLYIIKDIIKHRNYLVYLLIQELIKIKFQENKINIDTGNENEITLFLFLAAIYFGFGEFISKHSSNSNYSSDAVWESEWYSPCPMNPDLLGYCLAAYSKIIRTEISSWKDEIPSEIYSNIELSLTYFKDNPETYPNQNEIKLNEEYYHIIKKNDINKNLDVFEIDLIKLNKKTEDDILISKILFLLATITNEKMEYSKSIEYLNNYLEIFPEDNIIISYAAYSLFCNKQFQEGKKYLDQINLEYYVDNEILPLSTALYYAGIKDFAKSDEYFQICLENKLVYEKDIEYQYGLYSYEMGKRQEGLHFLKKSAQKGYTKAIKKLEEIGFNY